MKELERQLNRFAFTEARVRALPFQDPARDRYPIVHLDSKLPGFMVICHRASKTYYFQADRPTALGPRTTRIKVDRTDSITLKDAWERAEVLRSDLRKGIHPKERLKASAIEQARNTFTLRDAVNSHLYERKKVRTPKTIREYEKVFATHLRDWLDRPLREVGQDKAGLVKLHDYISKFGWNTESRTGRGRRRRKGGAPYSANGMIAALRAVYKWAKRERPELNLPEFPNVETNPVAASEKHVPLTELKEWFGAVINLTDQHGVLNSIRRDAHLFTMFSGLRLHDVVSLEWKNVNWEERVAFLPLPKGGKARARWYPLSTFLLGVLEGRKTDAATHAAFPESPWVFPAVSRSGHVPDLDQDHHDYLKQYGAKDYRHSFASYAGAAGLQQYQIGFLLGHRQESINVTFKYARALLDPLREDLEKVHDFMYKKNRGDAGGSAGPACRA